jgi:UTP--glucose-1-phosphate uridylyltransferase
LQKPKSFRQNFHCGILISPYPHHHAKPKSHQGRHHPALSGVAGISKEMFPLVDRDGRTKPVMHMLVEEAIESGIKEICIITQPATEHFYRDYFQQLKKFGNNGVDQSHTFADRISIAHQTTPDGFGHAVFQARPFAKNDPFVLMLGDHIFISRNARRCAQQLIDVFENLTMLNKSPSAVTAVQLTEENDLHLFGTIRGNPVSESPGTFLAEKIIEKPSVEIARQQLTTANLPVGQFLCHFGIHLFSVGIFDSLDYHIQNNIREKNEIQLTSAQEHLRQSTGRYFVSQIEGIRCDMGIPKGLLETQSQLAKSANFQL